MSGAYSSTFLRYLQGVYREIFIFLYVKDNAILDIAIYLLGHGIPFVKSLSFFREKRSLRAHFVLCAVCL
jgi:hypothetical protein